MSKNQSKPAALPPKVAQYLRESKAILAEVPELQKTAAEAEQLKQQAAAAKEHQAKLASDTVGELKQVGLITDADQAKFASDLAEPGKAHNLIRYLGKKLAAAEANAAVKPMGNPDRGGQGPSTKKTAEDGETANDRFASRVRAAAGV